MDFTIIAYVLLGFVLLVMFGLAAWFVAQWVRKSKTAVGPISTVTGLTVALMALVGFVINYSVLHEIAAGTGKVAPALAWVWPLTLDGVMIVSSLSVLRKNLLKEGAAWEWILTIIFSLASAAFAVSTVGLGTSWADWTARGVLLTPPLVTVLTFHLLTSQIWDTVKGNVLTLSVKQLEERERDLRETVDGFVSRVGKIEDIEAELPQLRERAGLAAQLQSTLDAAKLAIDERDSAIEKLQAQLQSVAQTSWTTSVTPQGATPQPSFVWEGERSLLSYLVEHDTVAQQDIALAFGVDPSTVSRAVNSAIAGGRLRRSKNGDGKFHWFVLDSTPPVALVGAAGQSDGADFS